MDDSRSGESVGGGRGDSRRTAEVWRSLIFYIIPPAVLFGIVCLSAPVVLVLRNARREKGRASGIGAVAGSRPFVLIAAAALAGVGILIWRPLPLDLPDSIRFLSTAAGAALYFPGTWLYL